MDSAVAANSATGRRRLELDLIRAAVVSGVVFFHTVYILDPPTSAMIRSAFFVKLWGMPLMFMVAGASIWHSLRARTAGEFVRERLSRLLIPLAVGVLLIVPPQVYYSLRAESQDPGSYWQFLGRFFDVRLTFDFPWIVQGADPARLFDVAHLWFLYYLLIYSLLLLPAFLCLQRDSGRWLVERLVAACQRPWGILVLAVPVATIEAALGSDGPGGWNNYTYLSFLLLGFLVYRDRSLGETIRQNWRQALVTGFASLALLFVIAHYDIGGADRRPEADFDLWSVIWRLLKATGGWAWAVAIFGLAASLVRSPKRETSLAARIGEPSTTAVAGRNLVGRAICYANEAVLPFYVLHQTVMVIIGFYVLQWRMGVLCTYLTVSLGSLAATLFVYDLCIRRSMITRVLFGMSPRVASTSSPAVSRQRQR